MDVLLELAGNGVMWGASRDGSEGCSCETALPCQGQAAGEEGNLGQAGLRGCIRPGLGTAAREGASVGGSLPGGEGEGMSGARSPPVHTAMSQPCPAQ